MDSFIIRKWKSKTALRKKQKEIESPLFAVMLQNGQILIQTFFKNNQRGPFGITILIKKLKSSKKTQPKVQPKWLSIQIHPIKSPLKEII